MNENEVLEKVEQIRSPTKGFSLFTIGGGGSFFGKTSGGHIAFVVESAVGGGLVRHLSAGQLDLYLNVNCCYGDGLESSKLSHILCYNGEDLAVKRIFVRLVLSFFNEQRTSEAMEKMFFDLKTLFISEKVSAEEVRGVFGELYLIYKLASDGIDISSAWQEKDQLKYDFFINDVKRIDVKTTLLPNRIHHFLHEQISSGNDVCIVSLMLKAANCGVSVLDVVSFARSLYSNNCDKLMILESRIHGHSDSELAATSFDKKYLEENVKVYDARFIPQFSGREPNGVSGAAYMSDLSNIQSMSKSVFYKWVRVGPSPIDN